MQAILLDVVLIVPGLLESLVRPSSFGSGGVQVRGRGGRGHARVGGGGGACAAGNNGIAGSGRAASLCQ